MWQTYSIEGIIRTLRTNKNYGLSSKEAENRLNKYRQKHIKGEKERKFPY